MKKIFAILMALLWVALPAGAMKVEDVPNVHSGDSTRYVSDAAGILSGAAIARCDSMLAGVWRATGAEPVVVTVPDLSGDDIDTYATELFTKWGIGKRDRDSGLLLLISRDDRKMCIRTGYGTEEFMPDVLASSLIRNVMAPRFREGDYDGGVTATVECIAESLSSEEARQALMSKYVNNADARSGDEGDGFGIYLALSGCAAAVLLALVGFSYVKNRKEPTAARYEALRAYQLPALVATLMGLGIPLVAYLVLMLLMRHVRLHKRLCPNCSTRMARVDEDHDNDYLTPSQDAEERLDSVDYDVWLCPSCGETDIIPYVNPRKNFTVCPVCHARACALVGDRVLRQPTTRYEGQGVKLYQCANCRHTSQKMYNIPKVVEPPVVIIPGGGRGGGGFGGGGFGGGSFGGGATGGGGASGGW